MLIYSFPNQFLLIQVRFFKELLGALTVKRPLGVLHSIDRSQILPTLYAAKGIHRISLFVLRQAEAVRFSS